MDTADTKEVVMDVEQGVQRPRKRRAARRTKKADTSSDTVVEKATDVPQAKVSETTVAAKPVTKPVVKPAPIIQQKVVLQPKKKPAKLLLVPHTSKRMTKKIFKARRIRMHIDNTAKTQKKQRQFNHRIEAMSDAQVREAVVAAKLARIETLAKAPISLLKGMLRDYHMLRGGTL